MAQKPLLICLPGARLSRWIRCFWLGHDPVQQDYAIIPDGCIDIVLRCRQTVASQIAIFGSTTQFSQQPIVPNHRYIGIRFEPGQARHFIPAPAWQLTNNVSNEMTPFLQWLTPVLNEEHPQQVFEMLQRLCCKWLKKVNFDNARFDKLLHELTFTIPDRLTDFCGYHGISERHLQRHFKQHVGLSPKQYLRILRAHRIKERLETGQQTPLAQMALAAGYADQSHMQREVKSMFGQTPLSFIT